MGGDRQERIGALACIALVLDLASGDLGDLGRPPNGVATLRVGL